MTGPTKRTIPAQTYQSCSECEHFENKMIASGQNPIYYSYCRHPAHHLFGVAKGWSKRLISNRGSDRTPQWCPELTGT